MNLEKYWTGKKVVITGASSGLGTAITKALAPYKAHFCLLSRRIEPMQELSSQLSQSGSKFWIRSCDVQNRVEVEKAIDEFAKEASGIDVAWINSGIASDSSFRNWNWDSFEQMIDTNLKGAIYTTHTCLKHMVPQNHGTIVGISSAAAMRGLPSRGIYSVTKISLAYYLESIACELPQIQFTTIYPGYVDTPINQSNPNRFWLMTADRAAQLMISAVASGKKEYIYPFRMGLLFHLIRSLPASLYRRVGNRNLEKASVNPKI
jgi:short-subunit dehydrogenase